MFLGHLCRVDRSLFAGLFDHFFMLSLSRRILFGRWLVYDSFWLNLSFLLFFSCSSLWPSRISLTKDGHRLDLQYRP